jgi:hypothetical protein
MTHVRTLLRRQIKKVLDEGLSSDDYRIFANRKNALNHEPDRVVIDISFLNDQTQSKEVMNDKRTHIASLYIRVQRSAPDGELEELLDEDEVLITRLIHAYDWTGMIEEPLEIMQANYSDDPSGGHTMGSIILRYDIMYRIDRRDPEQFIP